MSTGSGAAAGSHPVKAMKLLPTLGFLLLALTSQGCGGGEPRPSEVRVFLDGSVTLDGVLLAPSDFAAAFKKVKEGPGAVWYYREVGILTFDMEGDPVFESMREAGLGVSMKKGGQFPLREEQEAIK